MIHSSNAIYRNLSLFWKDMKLNKCAQSESNQEHCGTCIKHEDCNYYNKSTASQNAYWHASGKSHLQITIEIDNSKNSSLSRLWKNILFFLAQNSKVILFQTPESHFSYFLCCAFTLHFPGSFWDNRLHRWDHKRWRHRFVSGQSQKHGDRKKWPQNDNTLWQC